MTDQHVTDKADKAFEVPREDFEACYEAVKDRMTTIERPRNVARIAATLMTLHEDGWITAEEAAIRAEYIEAVLWEADIARRTYNAGF